MDWPSFFGFFCFYSSEAAIHNSSEQSDVQKITYFRSYLVGAALTAMGISDGIRQCRRKCRSMLVLQQQKKCCRKGFHICGLSFQILRCC